MRNINSTTTVTCTAENTKGKAVTSCIVTKNEQRITADNNFQSPYFVRELEDELIDYSEINLKVIVMSTPAADIEWFENEQPVQYGRYPKQIEQSHIAI